MSIRKSYNTWSQSYDKMMNKTRDLEEQAIRSSLEKFRFSRALELGCGTGKNTGFLSSIAAELIAVDFSEEMMKKAKEKFPGINADFRPLDINSPWPLESNSFELISTSLVLEHISNLDFVFAEAARVLKDKGKFYIGELHPGKQYLGSKAKFETENGIESPDCYVHHISEFFSTAVANGFVLYDLGEWFDDEEKTIPRVLTMIYEKSAE